MAMVVTRSFWLHTPALSAKPGFCGPGLPGECVCFLEMTRGHRHCRGTRNHVKDRRGWCDYLALPNTHNKSCIVGTDADFVAPGGVRMSKEDLSNDDLAGMARVVGLDPEASDFDEVLVWVRRFLAATDPLDELDLTGVKPGLLFVPGEGADNGQ